MKNILVQNVLRLVTLLKITLIQIEIVGYYHSSVFLHHGSEIIGVLCSDQRNSLSKETKV